VILDNCSTNAQIIQGNILQATASLACPGSAITVVDANNQTVSLSLTITAGTIGLQLAPIDLTVPESTNTPSLSLQVYGANGPIQVFTTNTGTLAPQKTVSNADGTYTITLTSGNTCSLVVTPEIKDVPPKDNSVPPNGTFTDKAAIPPAISLPSQPFDDVPFILGSPATGGDRSIKITVIDSTGRLGTSDITIKDTDKKAGCSQ
jgi:hypothetical protein